MSDTLQYLRFKLSGYFDGYIFYKRVFLVKTNCKVRLKPLKRINRSKLVLLFEIEDKITVRVYL